MKTRIAAITAIVSVVISLSACNKNTTGGITTSEQTQAATAPKQALPEAPPVPADTTKYQGEVVDKVKDGSIDNDTIKSNFPCTNPAECTSTPFQNTPKSQGDCTCKAACTPYVVNTKEAEARKAANEKFCSNEDWFGPNCPAPNCSFIEFGEFRCEKGVCVGIAEGKDTP